MIPAFCVRLGEGRGAKRARRDSRPQLNPWIPKSTAGKKDL